MFNDDVIRPLDNPIYGEGSLAVLRGNLAPDGCVIKPAAMDQRFLKHAGPALVFDDYPSMKKAVDDETLDVTADHVLVLRNAGTAGRTGDAGMGHAADAEEAAETGPSRHAAAVGRAHERHQLRRLRAARRPRNPGSAARSPCCAPATSSASTWPTRSIRMVVSDAELARRRAAWTPPEPRYGRGYGWVYTQHIEQADQGCDFDFLRTGFGTEVPEPDDLLNRRKTMTMALSPATRDKLRGVSTATLTTALFKRGLSQPVHPGRPPARAAEDDDGRPGLHPALHARAGGSEPHRRVPRSRPSAAPAIETCPPGAVFVIDSRKDARAASAGGILVTRLMQRGVAGVVTDGGFRDSAEIAALGFPAYHQRPAAPTNLTLHQAIDINVPIGCGDAPVFPGDVVVGDADGVVIVPAGIAEEIAAEAVEMTAYEDFVTERVRAGATIVGLYPATDPANLTAFAAWRQLHGR